jgi:hypothetical protein
MKALVITVLVLTIIFLLLLTNILYKPMYDKVVKEYVIDKQGVKLANICMIVMLSLSLAIGLII